MSGLEVVWGRFAGEEVKQGTKSNAAIGEGGFAAFSVAPASPTCLP